jgi:serine protease SohB
MPVISQLVARHFWPSTLNEYGSPGHPTPTSRSSEDAASKVEQRVFVIELGADVASALPFLTDVANFLTTSASAESDEVVFVLTSPGGSVTEFGLAAEQLGRIRRHGLPLTVCVDLIAASGGYMIAAVSSKLLCAPFAMVGSIGVITMTLNAHRAIKKRGLDVVTIAAGKYKAPISLLSELNAAALDKQQEVVDTVHGAFKQHIAYWRPW